MKKLLLISALFIFACSAELYAQEYDARYRVDGKMEVNSTSKINLDISNLSEAYSKTGIHNLGNGEYVSIDIDPKPSKIQFVDYYIHAEDNARRNLMDFMKGSDFNGYGYKETKASHQKIYGNGEVYALYKIYFKIFPKANNQSLIKRRVSSYNNSQNSGYDKIQYKEYFDSAKSKMKLEDYNGAISDFNKAIELDPNYAGVYILRGTSKTRLYDFYGAISDYTKVIEFDKISPSSYKFLFNGGVDKEDVYFFQAYYFRAITKMKLEDYNGAISDFNKAIELDPNNAGAYMNRGNTKIKLKDFYGAISDYTKVIELNPNDAVAYCYRGNSKIILGDLNGACNDWKLATELGNTDAAGLYNQCN